MFSTEELIFYTVSVMGFEHDTIYMDYSIVGDYYDQLVTTTNNVLVKPDRDAFNNAFREQYINQIRGLRNVYLNETDKYALPDYPHTSDDIRQAWLLYRQKLREVPRTFGELLDKNGFTIELEWPVEPTSNLS